MNDGDPRVLPGCLIRDLAGGIRRSVINNNPLFREDGLVCKRLNRMVNVRGLIPNGRDHNIRDGFG